MRESPLSAAPARQLAQPQTAEFVVGKLWREFVSPQVDAVEVKRISRMFRDNRYNIKVALRALLTSDAFYAPQNRAALIKSPVDLIVGTLRQFRFETGEVTPFLFAARLLGLLRGQLLREVGPALLQQRVAPATPPQTGKPLYMEVTAQFAQFGQQTLGRLKAQGDPFHVHDRLGKARLHQ